MVLFPRTEIGGLSVSRMILGTNWMLGYSHTTLAADDMIRLRYDAAEAFKPVLETALLHGVDTVMAPFSGAPKLVEAIKETEQKTGTGMILIDTPIIDVSNNPTARQSAAQAIRACADRGAQICLIHHASCEKLVNKERGVIDRLDDYTKMIRDAGMIPGLSAHMSEIPIYCDRNEYDVETYIQIFNCMGFLMQVEIETVARNIQNAKKPVITIKPMAAGRCSPYVGLTFSWNAIRSQDMVTAGVFSADELAEDIEISLAAIEHRFPQIKRRSSPSKNQAAFGN